MCAWHVTGSLNGFHKCCTVLAERIALPMAVWQFDLLFIPRDGHLPVRAQECFDASTFSSHEASVAQVWLLDRLGEPDEMMDDWFVYGSTAGNRVDVVLDEALEGGISARIDARSRDSEFVNRICDLCKLLEAKLFSVELWRLVEASPSAIESAFRCSRAAAYIQDPERFLRDAVRPGLTPP